MSIYALSDLHLSFNDPSKSMEYFGNDWKDYEKRIKENWIITVKENDTVIIPGDISWAMNLDEAKADFEYINRLPGKKIILKGNHDYYFSTFKKVEKFLEKNNLDTILILHNNSYFIENWNICGTRGWGTVADSEDKINNNKIIKRELGRLETSLISAKTGENTIVALHFPPTYEFKELMKKYNVKKCIYGHLHGEGQYMVKEGIIDGIEYFMVSGDYTKFHLIKVV